MATNQWSVTPQHGALLPSIPRVMPFPPQELTGKTQINSLRALQSLIFTVDHSLADIAYLSGISPTVIHRLVHCAHHTRLVNVISAFGILGLGLCARTSRNPHWQVLVLPQGRRHLPDGETMETLVAAATIRAGSVASVAARTSLSRNALERLRQQHLPPAVNTLLTLLSAVEGEVLAIGGDGSQRILQLPSCQPHSHKRKTIPQKKQRGRPHHQARLSKGDIVAMHNDLQMPCTKIAEIAGLSYERVRQILLLFGVEPARIRQRKKWISAHSLGATGPARP